MFSFSFFFLAPYARTTRYVEAFRLKAKNGLGRFALSALRFSGSSLIFSCLTVSFSCGRVYSLVKRMPESVKKKTYAYLTKRKMKKKMLVYVPGWHDLRKPRKKIIFSWSVRVRKWRVFHRHINTQTILKFPDVYGSEKKDFFMVCTGTKIFFFSLPY